MDTQVFPGRYDSLAKISQFVVKAAREAGLDDRAVYAVELAVDEACTNIIEHAYGGEGRGDLVCSVQVKNNELQITLNDRGRPFDPDKVPQPLLNQPLSKVKSRGVGIYLMSRMMDDIRYNSSPEQGNTLTMIKRV